MKYVVYFEQELYSKKNDEKYIYEHLTDGEESKYFDTFEEAKKYVDNYNIKIEKIDFNLYVDYLSIHKYNEETGEAEEKLYDKTLSYEEIEQREDIKLAFD